MGIKNQNNIKLKTSGKKTSEIDIFAEKDYFPDLEYLEIDKPERFDNIAGLIDFFELQRDIDVLSQGDIPFNRSYLDTVKDQIKQLGEAMGIDYQSSTSYSGRTHYFGKAEKKISNKIGLMISSRIEDDLGYVVFGPMNAKKESLVKGYGLSIGYSMDGMACRLSVEYNPNSKEDREELEKIDKRFTPIIEYLKQQLKIEKKNNEKELGMLKNFTFDIPNQDNWSRKSLPGLKRDEVQEITDNLKMNNIGFKEIKDEESHFKRYILKLKNGRYIIMNIGSNNGMSTFEFGLEKDNKTYPAGGITFMDSQNNGDYEVYYGTVPRNKKILELITKEIIDKKGDVNLDIDFSF